MNSPYVERRTWDRNDERRRRRQGDFDCRRRGLSRMPTIYEEIEDIEIEEVRQSLNAYAVSCEGKAAAALPLQGFVSVASTSKAAQSHKGGFSKGHLILGFFKDPSDCYDQFIHYQKPDDSDYDTSGELTSDELDGLMGRSRKSDTDLESDADYEQDTDVELELGGDQGLETDMEMGVDVEELEEVEEEDYEEEEEEIVNVETTIGTIRTLIKRAETVKYELVPTRRQRLGLPLTLPRCPSAVSFNFPDFADSSSITSFSSSSGGIRFQVPDPCRSLPLVAYKSKGAGDYKRREEEEEREIEEEKEAVEEKWSFWDDGHK